METKAVKTMRKLYQVMPHNLRAGWRFDASNVGRSFYTGYGIVTREPGTSLGISVDVASSFRSNPYYHDQNANDVKTGCVLAAWVAAANPDNVMALLDTIQILRADLADERKDKETEIAWANKYQSELLALRQVVTDACTKLGDTFYWSDVEAVIARLRALLPEEQSDEDKN